MDVGFVGLGQMGQGMAGRLIDAGHRVTVWNRDRAKAAPFEQRGARVADRPADAARAGVVLAAIPVMALFLWLQKYIVGGLTAGAVK